jgi:hypothetical protein
MRFLTTSLVIAVAALAFTACSGNKSSNASDQSNAAATSAAATAGAEASAAGAGGEASSAMAKANAIPTYPGAVTQAAGSSSGMGAGTAAGKVMSTADSFDKVYKWYQQNMPAGSEKAHVTAPVESAVFTIGNPGEEQTSVTINSVAGKTMITIGHVKM